jgi:hypothetical protein
MPVSRLMQVVCSLFFIPVTIRVWNECLRIAGLGHRRIRFALRFVASSSEVVDSEVVNGSPAIQVASSLEIQRGI